MKRVDDLREAIITQVADGYSMPMDVADNLGAKRQRVVQLMSEMVKSGKLVRIKYGQYSLPIVIAKPEKRGLGTMILEWFK